MKSIIEMSKKELKKIGIKQTSFQKMILIKLTCIIGTSFLAAILASPLGTFGVLCAAAVGALIGANIITAVPCNKGALMNVHYGKNTTAKKSEDEENKTNVGPINKSYTNGFALKFPWESFVSHTQMIILNNETFKITASALNNVQISVDYSIAYNIINPYKHSSDVFSTTLKQIQSEIKKLANIYIKGINYSDIETPNEILNLTNYINNNIRNKANEAGIDLEVTIKNFDPDKKVTDAATELEATKIENLTLKTNILATNETLRASGASQSVIDTATKFKIAELTGQKIMMFENSSSTNNNNSFDPQQYAMFKSMYEAEQELKVDSNKKEEINDNGTSYTM